MKDKATGDEKNFINKEEEKLLKNLLKKLKDEASETPAKREKEQLAEIKDLCSQHKVPYTDELAKELFDWKYSK